MIARIRLSEPALAGELLEFFAGAGFDGSVVEPGVVAVTCPATSGADRKELRVEMEFAVRAWALLHPEVAVELDSVTFEDEDGEAA